jgi:ubiquinone/menaquinone biosynthesis C-methylase UbiE
MNSFTNKKKDLITNQYIDSKNFMARVELNRKFGKNPYKWTLWLFDQIKFQKDAKILELGGGNALLWRSNLNRIPKNIHIVLSDLSEGMLDDAKKILGNAVDKFELEIIDAQQIPYPQDSFNIIIANLMLYHVPNRKKALHEISRVLKNDGTFYATAFSAQYMKELTELIYNFNKKNYNPLKLLAHAFGLENGKKQLTEYFEDVKLIKYNDLFEVTEAKPLVNFVLSSSNVINHDEIEDFTIYTQNIIHDKGKLKIKKDSGLFVAKKPK